MSNARITRPNRKCRTPFSCNRVAILMPWLGIILACFAVSPGNAHAGFSIEISVDGGVPTVIFDNDPEDNNDLVDYDMEVDFTVTDLANTWSATGTVLATGGGGYPPVATVVTNLLIENTGGAFLSGQIKVVHNYAASGAYSHTALLHGQFENLLGNNIGLAWLDVSASVNAFAIGGMSAGPVEGVPGPVEFFDAAGPLLLPTTTQHTLIHHFYLGDPGDAIRLFNSSEIHTVVPEASSTLLALTGTLIILGRARSRWARRRA